jgi:hypothetical protein
MPLAIHKDLLDTLHHLRARQLLNPYPGDEVFLNQPVVVLTLGLGPAFYLGLDGRVIRWGFLWDDEPPRETTDLREIASALVIGARSWDIPELLDLLPTPPANAATCPQCAGDHWVSIPTSLEWIVCPICNGLGWLLA